MEAAVQRHILMLLDVNDEPVQGKTMLMYQLFQIFREVSPELKVPYFPYQFGPYSNIVARAINWLKKHELIDIKKVGRTWMFTITEKGKLELMQNVIHKTDEILKGIKVSQIARIKTTTHEMGLRETRESIKIRYPQYFINARV